MSYVMYDDASVGQFSGLTAAADVFAGYIDGYVTFPWLVANRKGHKLVSISIHGGAANCLDIENGAASIPMIPSWLAAARKRTLETSVPVLYCAAGQSQSVINEALAHGFKRTEFLLWSAHVGHGEHICAPNACGYPQADGTQWTWTALGRSLDQSLLSSDFFGPVKPVVAPKPAFYTKVSTGTVSLYQVAEGRKGKGSVYAELDHIVYLSTAHLGSGNLHDFTRYLANGVKTVMPKGLVYLTTNK
jgi:hypothetical protein